jgi:hypothetical protein
MLTKLYRWSLPWAIFPILTRGSFSSRFQTKILYARLFFFVSANGIFLSFSVTYSKNYAKKNIWNCDGYEYSFWQRDVHGSIMTENDYSITLVEHKIPSFSELNLSEIIKHKKFINTLIKVCAISCSYYKLTLFFIIFHEVHVPSFLHLSENIGFTQLRMIIVG